MVQTRSSASQDDPVDPSLPSPPPPPAATSDPSLGQFMAAHAQLMSTMMQNMNQMMAQQSQATAALLAMMNQNSQLVAMQPSTPVFPQSKLVDFLRTRPPTFSSSPEPLDADDWLRSADKCRTRD